MNNFRNGKSSDLKGATRHYIGKYDIQVESIEKVVDPQPVHSCVYCGSPENLSSFCNFLEVCDVCKEKIKRGEHIG